MSSHVARRMGRICSGIGELFVTQRKTMAITRTAQHHSQLEHPLVSQNATTTPAPSYP